MGMITEFARAARTLEAELSTRHPGRGRRVVSRIAQPLSGHIEAGTVDSGACQAALDRVLAPLRDADAIVLACTHYPAIRRGGARGR